MHERSLVRSLLGQAAAIADEHGGGPIREIQLRLGGLCGYEPELVATAFAELADGPRWRESELTIECPPLESACPACGRRERDDPLRARCPQCGGRLELPGSDRCELVSVTLGGRGEPPAAQPQPARETG